MKFKNEFELLKAEQQAQKTVLAKHQQQQQKSRMKDVGSFASKYQPLTVEEECLNRQGGIRQESSTTKSWEIVYEAFGRASRTARSHLVWTRQRAEQWFLENHPAARGYRVHWDSGAGVPYSTAGKSMIRGRISMFLEQSNENDDDEDPFYIADESRERRMRRQPFFKHKYKDKETEETIFHDQCNTQEAHDYETLEANKYEFQSSGIIDNMKVSIISDFLDLLTPENMNVASLGLADTDEDDLFGDLEEFERLRYDVRSTVSEHKKIKVNAKLTLPSEHKKITSTFVIEDTQTVEDEEYKETIKELLKNEKSHTMLADDASNLKNLEKPIDAFCCQRAK